MPAASQVTREQMRARLVRYGELVPCRTAFIDTRTPGSESKENFTIIGPGVAENPDQHVHIREPHGFNIGAARQPPGCVNSQHSHETAEVFWIHAGRWRFMTGEHGEDGEVVLERGDTISIPIHVFRGFENIGSGEGFMFAALGGDDPGRVTWAPYVFDDARKYGLVLLESGRLIDTEAGETVPDDEPVMPATTSRQVAELKRLDSAALESCVARYRSANAAAGSVLARKASGGPRKRATHHRTSQPGRGRADKPLLPGSTASTCAASSSVLAPVCRRIRARKRKYGRSTKAASGSLGDHDSLDLGSGRRAHRPHRTRTHDRKPERLPGGGLRRSGAVIPPAAPQWSTSNKC